jgi:DNA-binding response OmpR family regulator
MPGKILVVEDDRAITQSLMRLLARDDYYVYVTHSAEEASEHLMGDVRYDLALLDVTLPGRDGFSLCRQLREQGHRLPVLMLTGRTTSTEKVIGLQSGADDYITKPFDPAELLARISSHLRRSRDYNAPTTTLEAIEIGPDLVLDLKIRDARLDGVPAKLTDREYELLLVLARHKDTALDKLWIFQEIWGCAPEMGLKALAVYVRRLRQKIERDEAHPKYVQTVRGYGYKLVTCLEN